MRGAPDELRLHPQHEMPGGHLVGLSELETQVMLTDGILDQALHTISAHLSILIRADQIRSRGQ
jgi:hypothetical protein